MNPNLTPYKPGQSGNPSGRPKSKPFKEAIQRALKAAGDDQDTLELIAGALIGQALLGEVPAIKEIGDRLDGKVTQPIAGDEDGEPIVVRWQK